MLKQSKQRIDSAKDLVGHLNEIFSTEVTAETIILDIFEPDFLPQLGNHFRANCGRTFDPKAVGDGTTIKDLYSLLQTPS